MPRAGESDSRDRCLAKSLVPRRIGGAPQERWCPAGSVVPSGFGGAPQDRGDYGVAGAGAAGAGAGAGAAEPSTGGAAGGVTSPAGTTGVPSAIL